MYIFYLKANRYFGYILSDHATPPPLFCGTLNFWCVVHRFGELILVLAYLAWITHSRWKSNWMFDKWNAISSWQETVEKLATFQLCEVIYSEEGGLLQMLSSWRNAVDTKFIKIQNFYFCTTGCCDTLKWIYSIWVTGWGKCCRP